MPSDPYRLPGERETAPAVPARTPSNVDLAVQVIVRFVEGERAGYEDLAVRGVINGDHARGARAALGNLLGRLTGVYPND